MKPIYPFKDQSRVLLPMVLPPLLSHYHSNSPLYTGFSLCSMLQDGRSLGPTFLRVQLKYVCCPSFV